MKKIFCFIPARLKSSRFPNKMLLDVKGKKLVNHVYDVCKKNKLFHNTYLATCDKILEIIAKKNNANVIKTSVSHQDCISRVIEAVKKLKKTIKKDDHIVIVQGDEACITSAILDNFCKIINKYRYDYYNLVSKIDLKKDFFSPSVVKCAINDKNEIIFMTRHSIPFNKNNKLKIFKTYRQTGVIAFTKKSLLKYSKLNQNYFEKYESIDMLRVLESGFKICSFKTKKRMIGLDTKSDYKELKKIL